MVEDAKTMSRSVAEQARRRGPPGPHPPRLIPRLIPAPGPEAQQQLGGRGPAGQGTARVDLTGRCGEQLRFRSKSWRSHCAELCLRCFGLRCVPSRVLPCCFRSLPNDLNPVLEELENVPTSCQLRGEWAISDNERLSFLDVEGPCTQPGFGRAEEAYYQMQPDKALDRLPRVKLVNPCSYMNRNTVRCREEHWQVMSHLDAAALAFQEQLCPAANGFLGVYLRIVRRSRLRMMSKSGSNSRSGGVTLCDSLV